MIHKEGKPNPISLCTTSYLSLFLFLLLPKMIDRREMIVVRGGEAKKIMPYHIVKSCRNPFPDNFS